MQRQQSMLMVAVCVLFAFQWANRPSAAGPQTNNNSQQHHARGANVRARNNPAPPPVPPPLP
eukprot:scaffold651658_cov42-Prasinocladus_malaysianus.AAC.1